MASTQVHSEHLAPGSVTSTALSNTGVTPGSYTSSNLTIDAQGRITAASSGAGGAGTINSGTAGQLAYYNATGTTLSGNSLITTTNAYFQGLLRSNSLRLMDTTNQINLLFGGTNQVFINMAAPAATQTISIPDAGVSTATFVLSEGAITINGVKTFSKVPVLPNSSFSGSGGTITPDATLSSSVFVTVDAVTTINGPTGGYNGQKILFRLAQDATGHAVTFNTGAGNFSFSTDLPSFTASAANLTDYVGAVFNSGANRWQIIGIVKGF
jgi:hypothetical protein